MTDIDFGNPPKKIFGTVEASLDLAEAIGNDEVVKRAFSTFKQVPIRFYRDNVIACEGDAAEYIFFVVRGVVRSCRNFKCGCPQHRCLLSTRGFPRLDGSKALALHRGSNRRRGTIYQTERVIVPRVTGKSSCHFFAARDDQ